MKSMAKAFISGAMVASMRETGSKTKCMVKESFIGLTNAIMLVTICSTRSTDTEFSNGQMDEPTRAFGTKANNMAWVSTRIQKAKRSTVNGCKVNEQRGKQKMT